MSVTFFYNILPLETLGTTGIVARGKEGIEIGGGTSPRMARLSSATSRSPLSIYVRNRFEASFKHTHISTVGWRS